MGTKYRINPFTGQLDDSGAIIGSHFNIGQSGSAQELGDFVDSHVRFENKDGYPSTVYVNPTSGSDETGTGTSGDPFATIERAITCDPYTEKTARTIQLQDVDASYEFDFNLFNMARLTIQSTPEVVETRNISSVTSATRTKGIVFTVDGPTLTDNEWKGRVLYVGGVLGNNKKIYVHENDGNLISGRMVARAGFDSSQSSPAGGTVSLMKFAEIENTNADTIIIGNLEFTLNNVQITGNNMYVESGRLTILNCIIDDITQIGGEVFFISTIYNPSGSAIFGAIQEYAGNRARFYTGCVMTDRHCPITSTDGYFITSVFNGTIVEAGGIDFVGLGEQGIELNGANFGEAGWFVANQAPIFFVDNINTTCKGAFKCETDRAITIFESIRSVGSRVYIGECVGSIDADYLVTAQRGSYVVIDELASVTTALGTNTVSADGGVTECAYNYFDKTIIFGGSVKPIIDRTYETPVQVGTDVEVTTTGDDVRGDGSSGNPYATLDRAVLDIGWGDNSQRTITLGAGTFTLPESIVGLNNVTIEGTQTITETRNITGTPTVVSREGIVFTVDGAALTDDEWRDRHLQYTSTRNIVVKRNIGNTIYGVIYRTNALADNQFSISGTVGLIEFTKLQTPSSIDANLSLNSNLTFKFINLTSQSSRDIIMRGNPSVNFWACQWEVRRPVIEDSEVNFWSVSYTGGGLDGMLYIGPRSTVSMGVGSTFSDRLAGFNGCWINNSFGSEFQHNGLLFFRGLDATGIRVDAGRVTDISGLSSAITGKVIFDDYAATCNGFYDFNTQSTGVGGFSTLPELDGQINLNYIVQAQKGAQIRYNASSTLTTALGTNTVSADGGSTNCAIGVDETRIYNGTPTLPLFKDGGSLYVNTTAVGNVGAGEDDLMSYTMPANTLFNNSDRIEVVAGGDCQSTQRVKLILGSTTLLDHTFSGGSPKDWKITASIIKSGTGALKSIANLIDGGGSNVNTTYTAITEDPTTALVVKLTGQGTSNDDIVQELMTINYYAKP